MAPIIFQIDPNPSFPNTDEKMTDLQLMILLAIYQKASMLLTTYSLITYKKSMVAKECSRLFSAWQ